MVRISFQPSPRNTNLHIFDAYFRPSHTCSKLNVATAIFRFSQVQYGQNSTAKKIQICIAMT